ncbi:serine hydrolase [Lentzea sp. NBRC 105346]|uniref:serine hydrolase domain-containing protein n=1 Tax=Lentzea sp. NBRC 105346 TaxID=3032205 RepID=UPI0024A5B8D8|nr:serine hydrolase domain-containing protein [Lentzea sp. NBRC 105346]GLZ32975.1 serine hydrolase [Lentzea sp. NBRC 105346]
MKIPAIAVLSVLLMASPAHADANSGRYDRPQQGFAPPTTVLHNAAPESVGLDPAPINAALHQVDEYTKGQPHPLFSGAVTLYAHDGAVVTHHPTAWAVRYSDATTELPVEDRVPMATDTIFDMASISKLFTSVVVMRQVDAGRVDIDQPVSRYLPEFGVNGKEHITVKQLLTHTSGLEPFIALWRLYPDVPSRIKAVMDIKPKYTPGTTYVYSDLNLITLGKLVERVTGKPLDVLVAEGITGPLGMRDTGYNPPKSKLDRIAATEYQTTPPRGIVRGEVHDENAWSLGGVAGHAGIFSTAWDLATLGQTILNGGTYAGQRVLSRQSVELMLTNFNQRFPENSHGLGFELDQRWYMGALASPGTAGHTGFTGTSLVIDRASRSIAILLTNRVHPSRDWGNIKYARAAVASGLAKALAVKPANGNYSWTPMRSGATLSTPDLPADKKRVEFDVFVDLEPGDKVVVDGRTLQGYGKRRWERLSFDTTATKLTFTYTRAGQYGGRGVYVSNLRITGRNGLLFDGDPIADGWSPVLR